MSKILSMPCLVKSDPGFHWDVPVTQVPVFPITIHIHVPGNDLGRATKSGYSAAKKKPSAARVRMRLVGQCILGNWLPLLPRNIK